MTEAAPGPGPAAPAVYFLSDYGLADEFVGVVHAVLHRLAPSAITVDLTHGIPPFDVRSGAEALVRAAPHLGPGVVLAVVDPGVGGARRGVIVETGAPPSRPRWLVGPDNGLLLPAAGLLGGLLRAWSLRRPAGIPATFDGRDVFAPAAAALSCGAQPSSLGIELAPRELVRTAPPTVEVGEKTGRTALRAEVTWVDRFGNVQLAAAAADAPTFTEGSDRRTVGASPAVELRLGTGTVLRARPVGTFSELAAAELGVMVDANGRLSLVVREGSAADTTGVRAGDEVELLW